MGVTCHFEWVKKDDGKVGTCITIKIPDNCYGDYLDEDNNLIINPPPVGDREKREKLFDRSFNEWESF